MKKPTWKWHLTREGQRRSEAGEEPQSSPTKKTEWGIINWGRGWGREQAIAVNKLRWQRTEFREGKATRGDKTIRMSKEKVWREASARSE